MRPISLGLLAVAALCVGGADLYAQQQVAPAGTYGWRPPPDHVFKEQLARDHIYQIGRLQPKEPTRSGSLWQVASGWLPDGARRFIGATIDMEQQRIGNKFGLKPETGIGRDGELLTIKGDAEARKRLRAQGYDIVDAIDDRKTGMAAMVVMDVQTADRVRALERSGRPEDARQAAQLKASVKTNVVFRGTEPAGEGGTDILTDLDGKGRVGKSQYEPHARQLGEWCGQYTNADATGHSLGAAQAQRFASRCAHNVKEVVTFAPPGIGKDEAQAFATAPARAKVTHYIAKGDIVSAGGGQNQLPGAVNEVTLPGVKPLTELDGHSLEMAHTTAMLQGGEGIAIQQKRFADYQSDRLSERFEFVRALKETSGIQKPLERIAEHQSLKDVALAPLRTAGLRMIDNLPPDGPEEPTAEMIKAAPPLDEELRWVAKPLLGGHAKGPAPPASVAVGQPLAPAAPTVTPAAPGAPGTLRFGQAPEPPPSPAPQLAPPPPPIAQPAAPPRPLFEAANSPDEMRARLALQQQRDAQFAQQGQQASAVAAQQQAAAEQQAEARRQAAQAGMAALAAGLGAAAQQRQAFDAQQAAQVAQQNAQMAAVQRQMQNNLKPTPQPVAPQGQAGYPTTDPFAARFAQQQAAQQAAAAQPQQPVRPPQAQTGYPVTDPFAGRIAAQAAVQPAARDAWALVKHQFTGSALGDYQITCAVVTSAAPPATYRRGDRTMALCTGTGIAYTELVRAVGPATRQRAESFCADRQQFAGGGGVVGAISSGFFCSTATPPPFVQPMPN